MSTIKKLVSNTFVQLVGRVVGTMFGVLTVAVLTRSLGADGYGQFTLAITFLAVAGALADFGFTLTTTQMISEKGADESRIVSNAFTMRLISGVFFFALAVLVAWFMPYAMVVKLAIVVGAFSYFFMTASQMLIGVFQKNFAMWRPAVSEAVSRALIFGIVVWIAATNPSVPYMMGAFVVGNFLLIIMNLFFARKYAKIRFELNKKIILTFLSRSWPIAISIFFNLLYLKGDILFMSFYRTDAEIGLYGAAYKVLDVVTVIPTMFMGLMLPMMVAAWSSAKENIKGYLQQAFDFFAMASLPMLGGALVLAAPLMKLVAGSEFEASGPYLVILMIANTIVFFGILFGHAVVSINKQKAILPAYIFTAIVATVLYLLTIPDYGAYGAAWTTVIAEALIATMTCSMVIYHTKFRPKWKNFFVYLVASVVMTAGVYWAVWRLDAVSNWSLIALILGGGVIYFVVVLLLGGIKKETLKLLLKR